MNLTSPRARPLRAQPDHCHLGERVVLAARGTPAGHGYIDFAITGPAEYPSAAYVAEIAAATRDCVLWLDDLERFLLANEPARRPARPSRSPPPR